MLKFNKFSMTVMSDTDRLRSPTFGPQTDIVVLVCNVEVFRQLKYSNLHSIDTKMIHASPAPSGH